jgi:hypothetical protein
VEDFLPAALLHLREAEVVRLCGLARAARGQDFARTGKVSQAERLAGTLRATVLEGELARAVQARFSESGLDAWECACSPASPDETSSMLIARPPCEHVAALLSLWVREPEQFRRAVPTRPVPEARERGAAASAAEAPQVSEPEPAPVPSPTLADLAHLEETLSRLLNLLVLAGGRVTAEEAKRLFTRLELGEPEAALAALERLREAGFVLPVFAASSPRPRAAADGPSGWMVSEAALGFVRRVVPLKPLSELPEPERSALGLHVQAAALALPRLLVLVAAQLVDRSASASHAAESQQREPRSLLELDAALAGQWASQLQAAPEQVRFCLALLRGLGVLPATLAARPREPRSAALARPPFAAEQARETLLRVSRLALARPEAEVLRDLFAQWLHDENARELVELRDAGVRVAWQSQRQSRHALTLAAENRAARQFMVEMLRWVPVGQWWDFGALVEFVWRFQPGFLRGRQETFLRPQWWLERLPDGQPLAMDVRAEWRQAEGRYIALLLRRALHWLGVVDLALDAQGRLKGFRVTALGAFLLGAGPMPEPLPASAPAQPEMLQVHDDGTLLAALDDMSLEWLEMLLWWCEPLGATATALRFRPSAERFAAALDAGRDVAAWRGWLEALPQRAALTALLEQMERWAALYGQVRLSEAAALLEVADVALLHELEATLGLSARYVDYELAPGLVVLRPAAVEALLEAMQRRGYSPWVVNDEAADRP